MSRERLLKWYDVKELPQPMVPGGPIITTIPLPLSFATLGREVSIPISIKLKNINQNDREELKATIVWNFGVLFIGSVPQIEVVSQQMRFSIWRDAPLTGDRLCTVIDSGHITQILLNPPTTTNVTNTVTTTFICSDRKISGKHKYFLTAAAGAPSGFTVSLSEGGGAPVPITAFMSPTITEVHFSGEVIDENEKT